MVKRELLCSDFFIFCNIYGFSSAGQSLRVRALEFMKRHKLTSKSETHQGSLRR